MPVFYPTLHQHLATDYQRSLAVTAGAGTGKTEVLTRRIIKITAKERHLLDRLLVLTFTDKAAGEMKERIYQAIEGELARSQEPHFQRLKDTFHHNHINTFHAFCAALLREYPIEAGIDPYFRVLDETDKVFFLRRSIGRVLRTLAADCGQPDIHRLSGEFTRGSLTNALFDIIQKREHLAPWLEALPALSFPDYFERLKACRGCILREMSYKLHKSKVLDDCTHKLIALIRRVPFDTSVLSQRRDRLIELLPQLSRALEPAAYMDMDEDLVQALKKDIVQNLKLTKPAKDWHESKGSYEALKDAFLTLRYALQSFAIEAFDIVEAHEAEGFELLKALARTASLCLDAYTQEKAAENMLDFQDLQLKALSLFSSDKHRYILTELRDRFQYIMVDEFQDTNDLQWQIIRKIAADDSGSVLLPKLFIVGDEKQAIYSFRGGDVRLFSRVRQELKAANLEGGHHRRPFDLHSGLKDYADEFKDRIGLNTGVQAGEILFSENFRSAAVPIDFFNMFFRDLLSREVYEEYDARPQRLICAGNQQEGSVELFLVNRGVTAAGTAKGDEVPEDTEEDGADSDLSYHFKEALLIVSKLQEVFLGDEEKYARVRESARKGKPAAAILLNRRTMIKTYEEALRLHRIDFSVVRGRGFYQRQEIMDVGNLLQFLTHPYDDLSLAAVLRSPIGHLSDEGIFMLTRLAGPGSLYTRLLAACLKDCGLSALSEGDQEAARYAAAYLEKWLRLKDRLPLPQYLQRVLEEGGWYASFSRGSRGAQTVSNIEKLLDSAREKSLNEGMDLADFSEWLNDRIDHIEEEGEADVDIQLGGAVQIMTVHQSKGLEFPLVFVPDLGAAFNFGDRDLLHTGTVPSAMQVTTAGILRKETPELGLNAPNPDKDWESEPILLKKILKKRQRDQLIAERKRLFYVAATRAMDHLVLVGSANFSNERLLERVQYAPIDSLNSWMEWMMKILDLPAVLTSTQGTFLYHNDYGDPMRIPYRLFTSEDSLAGTGVEHRTEFPI